MGADGKLYLPTVEADARDGTLFARDARIVSYLVDVEAQARALRARHGSPVPRSQQQDTAIQPTTFHARLHC